MTSPTLRSVPLDEQATKDLARAAKRAHDAVTARDALIVRAVASGGGVREVARACGMNHTSILHIIKRDEQP